ncbi:hypothetical protein Y032_0115g468 [Ancylostoma ceylanicum]|nr:hypothetical protein Y032_0115g468 [Ancylostoma ceylanicum]
MGVSPGPQDRATSLDLVSQIAESNGYQIKQGRHARHRSSEQEGATKIPFRLPFISDRVRKAVRAGWQEAGLQDSVRVVEIPPANLKRQLVRNRIYDRPCGTSDCVICPSGRQKDCMVSGVSYLITCKSCGEEYTGKTGSPLCTRIKERLEGLAKIKADTPLGAHRRQCHENAPLTITATIFSHEPDALARKTLEAFWIMARN